MKQLPTTSENLQAGRITKELNLPIDFTPVEARNFDIETALQIFKEALKVLKDALSWWEKLMIFLGRIEAPELSDSDKIRLIKDIPTIKNLSKSERKNFLANKLIK